MCEKSCSVHSGNHAYLSLLFCDIGVCVCGVCVGGGGGGRGAGEGQTMANLCPLWFRGLGVLV